MTNPIVDPLVETPDTNAVSGFVEIDATESGAVTVTLNRPDRANALGAELVAALAEAFETLHAQDGVRVVFLRGAGGTFSAGHDREWLEATDDYSEQDNRGDALQLAHMLKLLHDIPALTVALVEGEASGGGIGLVCACDMAVAVAEARFAFSDVLLGMVPGAVGPHAARAIGPRRARELLVTGRPFDVAYAEKIGLVGEVVADTVGLAEAEARIAAGILVCGPAAAADAKALLNDVALGGPDHDPMDEAAKRSARAMMREEGREGVAAFLAGRPPSWTQL